MTIDQIAISLIVFITFALFVYGRWRYDIVAVFSLFILVISDKMIGSEQSSLVLDLNKIFLGFGHPAVVTVGAVLIISTAMKNSGVVDFLSRKIKPYIDKQAAHISGLSFIIAILSGFMNNVGALALMLPVTLKTAWEKKRSPSLLLMPLAFASILGGMITMIGTPPNIIISNVRYEQQNLILNKAIENPNSIEAKYLKQQNIDVDTFKPSSFGLFDFTPVGGIIALLGVVFISLFGWRLIPKDKKKKINGNSLFKIDDYITELRIPENSKFIGLSIKGISKLTNDRLTLFKLIENNKVKLLDTDYIIKKNDLFLAMADPSDLKEVMDEYEVRFTKEMRYRIDSLKENDTTFMEVVVTQDSPLLVG
jgi:di/tricarboxylate transporter